MRDELRGVFSVAMPLPALATAGCVPVNGGFARPVFLSMACDLHGCLRYLSVVFWSCSLQVVSIPTRIPRRYRGCLNAVAERTERCSGLS